MYIYEDDILNVSRSDDLFLPVEIYTDEGDKYHMQPGDVLVLSVKTDSDSESGILFTAYSETNTIFVDSNTLSSTGIGRYTGEIRLVTASGYKISVWPSRDGKNRYKINNIKNFVIMPGGGDE